MKKRLVSMLLALVMVLGMLPATALAASSEEEALGEVNIYNGEQKLSYLSINGRIRELIYTYFNYVDSNGRTKEIPAYCVNPNTKGVPQTVAPGESIKYLAKEKGSDPKVMGIIANGYPNPTVMTASLEFNGQIVTFEVQNTSVSTGVSIKKTGPVQAVPGQPIRYVFSQIKNSSNVALDSFYWRDQLPAQVTLSKIVTGSYNQPLSYKVVYKTNLSGDYRTLADNLSTSKVYVLDARPAVLGLAANERVTEVMFVFGNVKAGFAQVETPYIYAAARSGLANNSSIVNVADVGGLYNGQWIQAVSRWLTTVYTKTTVNLPKTGY